MIDKDPFYPPLSSPKERAGERGGEGEKCKMFIGPETVTSLLKPGMYKDGLLCNPCISMTKPVSVAKDSEEF